MRSASSPPENTPRPGTNSLAADAGALGVALDTSQLHQLERYLALLARWNAIHNLTAVDSPPKMVTHHLLDSLAIVPTLDRLTMRGAPCVLDVGSGGGLPGIPMAIARRDWSVTLIDKVAKKVAFLTQVKLELGLANVDIARGRVEALDAPARFDLIVARAFSSLGEFVRLSAPLLAPGGAWVAMKGVVPVDEVAALGREVPTVSLIETVRLVVPRLAAERHLLVLKPLVSQPL